ncbi:MAG: T9SS type A sorting domain-containing protein [Chitinophagales bacterium]
MKRLRKLIRLLLFSKIVFLSFFCSEVSAQKENRNWVFGYNCGIDFSDLNNPRVFESNIGQCYETAASISDSLGNLKLYLGETQLNFGIEIFNSDGNRIYNSDIKLVNSFSKGAFFLPGLSNKEHYYLLYTAPMEDSICPRNGTSLCFGIHYSLIDISNDSARIIEKDISLGSQEVYEGINAVKHLNGKDWWIIAKEMPKDGLCTNTFITYLLTSDGFEGPFNQDIGPSYCNRPSDPGAGIVIANSGSKMVFHGYSDLEVLELFEFDRCEGELYNYQNLDSNKLSEIYGCEFSPDSDLLYITELRNANRNNVSKLTQIDLDNLKKTTIWSDSSIGLNDFTLTQLKLAPDNKIYVSYSQRDFRLTKFNQYNNHLSFINFPNRKGTNCDFNPFEFELADSSYAFLALPHMPNYNLGPTGIYKADAGNDTLLCKSYMNGVKLGTPAIAGLSYSWSPTKGLDNSSIAQPTANPDSNMKYTLTITDDNTTSSCNQRKDSVYVKVETCTSIQVRESKDVKVFPNPTSETIYFQTEQTSIQNIKIYSLVGEKVLTSDKQYVEISQLPKSTYIYRVFLKSGETISGKFVKE